MLRKPQQLAKELSEMQWGDPLGKLRLSANEAHELGKSYVELLEALQDALHAYDKHGEHSEWDFARAAIAKALGDTK